MKIRPLNGYMVVECEPEEEVKGGIIIPEAHREKPRKAKVISIDKTIEDFKAGDCVLLPKSYGMSVKLEGKEYTIIKASDILGVIDE